MILDVYRMGKESVFRVVSSGSKAKWESDEEVAHEVGALEDDLVSSSG